MYIQTHLPSSFGAQIILKNNKMTSSGYSPDQVLRKIASCGISSFLISYDEKQAFPEDKRERKIPQIIFMEMSYLWIDLNENIK